MDKFFGITDTRREGLDGTFKKPLDRLQALYLPCDRISLLLDLILHRTKRESHGVIHCSESIRSQELFSSRLALNQREYQHSAEHKEELSLNTEWDYNSKLDRIVFLEISIVKERNDEQEW